MWKSGYPPLAFAEDSDYQLLEGEESFFAVNGSMIDTVSNMDATVLIVSGVVFAAILICAIRHFMISSKMKKAVVETNNAPSAYGSFVEGN